MKLVITLFIACGTLQIISVAPQSPRNITLPILTNPEAAVGVDSYTNQNIPQEASFANFLRPPTSPVYQYSNYVQPQLFYSQIQSKYDQEPLKTSDIPEDPKADQDAEEDMDTASTIMIGRHSGRFITPAIQVWSPPYRPYTGYWPRTVYRRPWGWNRRRQYYRNGY